MGKKFDVSDKLKEKLLYLKLSIIDKDLSKNKYILKDIDGYKYFLSNGNISVIYRRKGQPRRYFGGNPYTRENILNYIKENNINIELRTKDFKEVTAITNLDFYCPEHGEFQKSWNCIKNGQSCPICGRLKAIDGRRNNIEDIRIAFEKEGYILVSKKYVNNLQPLQYICNKHKDEGIQQMTWGNFIAKHQKCSYCTKEKVLEQSMKSPEEFEKEVKELYGNKFILLTPYTGCKNKIKMYCNDCHSNFFQAPNHLLEGHYGCNCKPTSLGELKVKEMLDKYHNIYIQQYRFDDCKNKRPLPFDFALFDNNIKNKLMCLIEYNGKQHYEPACFGGISKEKANENFIIQQNRDKLKEKYCKKHNIKLVKIPYWDFDNIENIIIEINNNNKKGTDK